MRIRAFLPTLLLGLAALAPAPKVDLAIKGDYVEARTASVFCGACHYNGELVTEGRNAVLAWNIASGCWNGVDLTGVRAMAEISCEANLSNTQANRTTEIVVDRTTTETQLSAMVDLIKTTGGANLGHVLPAHRTAIWFLHDKSQYDVTADGFADLTVEALPNNECCTQPHLVWYSPLVAVEHRKVGYTQAADYTAGTNGDTWGREDENSAFYGSFIARQ